MSKFTKATAEAAGWQFVHAAEEAVVSLRDGVYKVVPGLHRAEKYVKSSLINEVANTHEGLLESIKRYEDHLGNLPTPEPAAVGENPDAHDIAPGRTDEVPAEPETVPEVPEFGDAPGQKVVLTNPDGSTQIGTWVDKPAPAEEATPTA